MDPVIFVYLGLAVALVYLPMTSTQPNWPRSGFKTLPLLCFSAAAWTIGGSAYLVAGLFLSALGDFALSRRGERAFLAGLSAFALAHLAYIPHFLGLSGGSFGDGFVLFPLIAIFLVILMLSAEFWLIPHVGPLRWPVRAYVMIITGMGLAALSLPLGLLTIGAGLFILSDVILSLQLFRMGEDNPLVGPAGWAVWIFYIAGQALILSGGTA